MFGVSKSIIIVCVLTAVIHLVNVAAVSARIVGVRTKKVGSSTSIFNIVLLLANFANAIQAPLLAKTIEKNIANGVMADTFIFRLVIFSATIGTILGAFSIPTVQRILAKGVNSLYQLQSIFKVLLTLFDFSTPRHIMNNLALPSFENIRRLKHYQDMPIKLLILNVFVYGFISVGITACLYAGNLNPALRTTALSLSGVSIGVGTLCQMLFLEPFNSTLVDKTIDGHYSEAYLRKYLTFVVIARFCGTILGQFIFIPLANAIILIAEMIVV